MELSQSHQLRLVHMHASGAEEWLCPTCGRRLLLRWQPAYEKQVLIAGDIRAIHSASRAPQPERAAAGSQPSGADMADIGGDWSAEGLRPWVRWFHEAGLDDLWNQPL